MTDVTPLIKDKIVCECALDSCTLFGSPGRADREGKRHVRGCPCNRCRGRRNRSKGDRKALVARKALGIAGVNSRHEEVWGSSLRVEAKAGAQVGPILTRYMAAKQQSEASRSIGDNRPFVMAAMPDRGPGLLVIEIEELAQVLAALAENWSLIP